jgi:hypothetical protein
MPQPNLFGIVYKHTAIGDTSISPTYGDNTTPGALLSNTFTSTISSVVANRVYYIRSYTLNAGGYGYGPLITITSGVNPPTVTQTTSTPTQLEGNVTNTGGSSTLKRGFIIFKSPITPTPPAGFFNNSQSIAAGVRPSTILTTNDPNSAIQRIECGDGGTGLFSISISSISDLTNGSTYKVYAYSYAAFASAQPDDDNNTIKSYAYSSSFTFTKT